jgi:hypothetical protein
MNKEQWEGAFQTLSIECMHGGPKWEPADCNRDEVREEMRRVFEKNGATKLFEASVSRLVTIGR